MKSICTLFHFNNIEFKTIISFDEFGRTSDHPINNDSNGIAVLGDSFAMGWGVNDKETFSYLLEKKINRPVYNLGVSGYGTIRELIRLQEFIEKKDKGKEKKAQKSKRNLLKQINIEIYKRDDAALWK